MPCCYKMVLHAPPGWPALIPNQRPEMCPRASLQAAPQSAGSRRRCGLYDDRMKILTIGDGDFSFSLALARALYPATADSSDRAAASGHLVATSHESEQSVLRVYPNAAETLAELRSRGVTVHHNVDATDLQSTLPQCAEQAPVRFDRIIFNFPCIGRGLEAGHDGQNSEMEANKQLVRQFCCSAARLVSPQHVNIRRVGEKRVHNGEGGEVHITHKTKPPYNHWGIVPLATNAQSGLVWKGAVIFDRCSYRPYINRKALGAPLASTRLSTRSSCLRLMPIVMLSSCCDVATCWFPVSVLLWVCPGKQSFAATDALQYIFGLPSQASFQESSHASEDASGLHAHGVLLSLPAAQRAMLVHARAVGLDLNRLVRQTVARKHVGSAVGGMHLNVQQRPRGKKHKKEKGNRPAAHADARPPAISIVEPTLCLQHTGCDDLSARETKEGNLCSLGYASLQVESNDKGSGGRAGLMGMSWVEVLESCEPRYVDMKKQEQPGGSNGYGERVILVGGDQSCCVRVDPWLLARVRASLLQQ